MGWVGLYISCNLRFVMGRNILFGSLLEKQMNDDEIIEKIRDDQWWPFDRVDPKILQEVVRKDKQDQLDEVGEALL